MNLLLIVMHCLFCTDFVDNPSMGTVATLFSISQVVSTLSKVRRDLDSVDDLRQPSHR